jgi:hypothetical protein
MNEVVQFLWVEGPLSKIEQLCLKSFVDNGYDVHLYHYGPLEHVPVGVMLRDGREILPDDQIFKAESPAGYSYAAFADRFRYHLLWCKGGWWFDTDFVCTRKRAAPQDLTFASTWEPGWGECANNCAMWAHPRSDIMLELAQRCDELAKKEKIPFGSTGPFLVQQLVRDFKLEHHVAPWWEFCPYPWRMIHRVAVNSPKEWIKDQIRFLKHIVLQTYSRDFRAGYIRKSTRALHLHNEIWRSSGLDKNGTFFRLSLFERLKRKHKIT